MGGGLLNKSNSLKLQKFNTFNNRRNVILTIIILSILLLSGIYLYNSFAVFSEEKHFNVINGSVGDPGDVYFAYYVDDEITRNIPSQDSGYTLDIQSSICTNGVTVGWDEDNWTALINYQKYNAPDYTRTKCDLHFRKNIAGFITSLVSFDNASLKLDDYGNIRYIGANPNNYVSIDGEIWRIIGVMSDITNKNGIKKKRVKLIRNGSIGNYSWDTSASTINTGNGINEWSQAKLMKLLNPGYESASVGGSLYWNNKSGKCYNGVNNASVSCNFTSTGMKTKLKNLIDSVIWNTGAPERSDQLIGSFYDYERGSRNGKICSSGTSCNDTIKRTTTWTGKVGLMYPSDYILATSGGSTTDREACLNITLANWLDYSDCYKNSYLLSDVFQSTLTPASSTTNKNAHTIYCIYDT